MAERFQKWAATVEPGGFNPHGGCHLSAGGVATHHATPMHTVSRAALREGQLSMLTNPDSKAPTILADRLSAEWVPVGFLHAKKTALLDPPALARLSGRSVCHHQKGF